jgi:hypothetical protein
MIAQATRISLSNLDNAFESQGAIYQSNNSMNFPTAASCGVREPRKFRSNFFGNVTAIESVLLCVPVVWVEDEFY